LSRVGEGSAEWEKRKNRLPQLRQRKGTKKHQLRTVSRTPFRVER